MTTFSQLVDKMVSELKRPDLQVEIATYVNQTIRELHTDAKGGAVYYDSNLQEARIQADVDYGFTWTIPKVSVFQAMKAVRYDSLTHGYYGQNGDCVPEHHHHHNHVYADILKPGRGMNGRDHYCYRIQNQYCFAGYGGNGAFISLAWYEFPPILQYYPNDDTRPATYDEWDGWSTQDVTIQAQVSNWLLLRWPSVLEEGIRAKVYKRVSDTERSRTAYSMYTTLRQGLWTSEVGDLDGGH